jgi:phosphate transport system protein
MMSTSTTRSTLDHALKNITDDIARIGTLAGEQIRLAVRALEQRDTQLSHQVIADDARINTLRYRIEQDCLNVMARHQPASGDLRLVIAAIHMAVELERIGDHAAGIAGISLRIGDQPLVKPLTYIPVMQEKVNAMVSGALDAFLRRDADLARAVILADDEVDALYSESLRALIALMRTDSASITGGTYLLWVGHNLERCADRATNLCERVLFALTGELGDIATVA